MPDYEFNMKGERKRSKVRVKVTLEQRKKRGPSDADLVELYKELAVLADAYGLELVRALAKDD